MNDNYWHLIYNNLKILIDPFIFADRSTIVAQVNLVDTLKNYLGQTEPALCDVIFYYPKYAEEENNLRRIFRENEKVICSVAKPDKIIEFLQLKDLAIEEQRNHYNNLITIAINNKIPFILTNFELDIEVKHKLKKEHNIAFVNLSTTQLNITYFLQGFYNYFKFDHPIFGIDSPDIAHAMFDPLHKKLMTLEDAIKIKPNATDLMKERIRSFVHNRYIDILVTIDKINFYKIQQQIADIEHGIPENKNSRFHGSIRYHLNYYLLLLWGYTDHLCWIINDLFDFGYNPDNLDDIRKLGLKNTKGKKEFLTKVQGVDTDLYDYIVSQDFQEWLGVLAELRHKNAHAEMLSPGPLLQTTPESKLTDAEIDAILYKNNPPISPQDYQAIVNTVGKALADSTVETQKIQDRANYKISKMNKLMDYLAVVKSGFFDPVNRIKVDKENLEKITEMTINAFSRHNKSNTK